MSVSRILLERRSPALAAAAALALAACSLGPTGEPPAMPSPAHYGQTPLPEQTQTAAGVAQHFDVGAQPTPQAKLSVTPSSLPPETTTVLLESRGKA